MAYDDTYLQQTISNQRHQQLMAALFPHQRGVLWGVHAGEVKHSYIWLAVVVDGVIQRRKLVVCGKICSLTGIREQSLLVYVVARQQPFSLNIVLGKGKNPQRKHTFKWKIMTKIYIFFWIFRFYIILYFNLHFCFIYYYFSLLLFL